MDVKRTVKLMPRKPVYGVKRTPITSSIEKIELTTEEIRLCLVTKCMVDEYLPDGSLLRLDFSNYNKDNTVVKEVEIVEPIVEPELEIVVTPNVELELVSTQVDEIIIDPVLDYPVPNVEPELVPTQVDEIDIDPILDYSIFNVEITPENPVSDNSVPNVEPELVPTQVDEIDIDPIPGNFESNEIKPDKAKGDHHKGSKKNH